MKTAQDMFQSLERDSVCSSTSGTRWCAIAVRSFQSLERDSVCSSDNVVVVGMGELGVSIS